MLDRRADARQALVEHQEGRSGNESPHRRSRAEERGWQDRAALLRTCHPAAMTGGNFLSVACL
eukprot:6320608-Pyramimonas_sp.AAC.1